MNRYVRISLGSSTHYAVYPTTGQALGPTTGQALGPTTGQALADGALLDAAPWLGGKPTGEKVAITQTLAPVEPSKIIGIGTNYRAHAVEMNKPLPQEPLLFMKPPSALIGHDATIVRPEGYERTDYEGELGVVIGTRARRVAEKDALQFIFGYTIVNDVSVRDLQKRDGQFTRAKGFDTFCPVGPAVVTGIDDPRALKIVTRLNGEVKQNSSTADLVFGVAQLVSFVSHVMTLEPGDLIATGTPPGVGPIAPGDEIEIEIERVGILRNRVAAP